MNKVYQVYFLKIHVSGRVCKLANAHSRIGMGDFKISTRTGFGKIYTEITSFDGVTSTVD